MSLSTKKVKNGFIVGALSNPDDIGLAWYVDNEDVGQQEIAVEDEDNSYIPFTPLVNGERYVHLICGTAGSGKSQLAKTMSRFYSQFMKCVLVTPVPSKDYKCEHIETDQLVQDYADGEYDEAMKEWQKKKIRFKYVKRAKELDQQALRELEIALEVSKPKKPKNQAEYQLTDRAKQLLEDHKAIFFIFDDCEAEDLVKKNQWLQKKFLLTGRHNGIHMVIINHNFDASTKLGRYIISESHTITIFKRSLDKQVLSHECDNFLEKYRKVPKRTRKLVEKLLNEVPGRYGWVTIFKEYPIIVSSKKILIDQ